MLLLKYHNQRPFWDTADEVDPTIIIDAFVVLYRFVPRDEVMPLFAACLEPDRSDGVKICTVLAIRQLILEVRPSRLLAGYLILTARAARNISVAPAHRYLARSILLATP
jgi:hypothetical protein